MDEPIKKAGQYPNVAIMAGTDPEKVKKFYGVKPSVFDVDEWEPQRVDYLCDMCANDCDERRVIHIGQGAYSVCERWEEAER